MKIIKCYNDYYMLRLELLFNTYDISNDSIGQYNADGYSVDVTVREYDEGLCIDYDVYKTDGNEATEYLDGGKVCDISNLPKTEKTFWKLVRKKFEEHINKER